jgi:hypothetical protein
MKHISWCDIENFHTLRKTLDKYPELLRGRKKVTYRGKVKLHGTNAAIQYVGGKVIAQSRTQIISPGNDNCGFAAWVETFREELEKKLNSSSCSSFVIYGEWCGPGIMKGVAVNQIPEKQFAVFGARLVDHKGAPFNEMGFLYLPTTLQIVIDKTWNVPCKILPWYGDEITIDFSSSSEELNEQLVAVNEAVAAVEACDPWVEENFGVKGIGEGIVYYPVSLGDDTTNYKIATDLMFKAKGEQHKVVTKSKAAQADPAVAESAAEFARMVLPLPRLEQGARAVNRGEFKCDMKLIGPFLKWVNEDIAKECDAELEASGIDRKVAMKACSDFARTWYMTESRK